MRSKLPPLLDLGEGDRSRVAGFLLPLSELPEFAGDREITLSAVGLIVGDKEVTGEDLRTGGFSGCC